MIAKIPCDLVINGVLTTFDIIMEPGLVDTLKSLDNQIESDTNKLLSSSVKVTTYDGSYIYFKKIDGTELFKLYRNDSLDTEEIEVDYLEVTKALNRFTSFSNDKKQVENDQKRIERDYEQIKKQVKDLTKRNGDLNLSAFIDRLPEDMRKNVKSSRGSTDNQQGFTMSGDLMYKLDLYTKAKVDQITEFSNIHTLAFSAKLDALKESYKQDRALLYTALLKIQRTDNARKEK